MSDFWGEPIHTYTRAEALADGVLVDVSGTAAEAGFLVPVALTAGVAADVGDIPPGKRGTQDAEGRLWDVLWMGRYHASLRAENAARDALRGIEREKFTGPEFVYSVRMDVGQAKRYDVKMHLGPGDDGEPVVTIMRPEED